jgi:hypothetical protein
MSQVHINRRRAKETLKSLEPASFGVYACTQPHTMAKAIAGDALQGNTNGLWGRTMIIHVPVVPRKLLCSTHAMTVRHRRSQWRRRRLALMPFRTNSRDCRSGTTPRRAYDSTQHIGLRCWVWRAACAERAQWQGADAPHPAVKASFDQYMAQPCTNSKQREEKDMLAPMFLVMQQVRLANAFCWHPAQLHRVKINFTATQQRCQPTALRLYSAALRAAAT